MNSSVLEEVAQLNGKIIKISFFSQLRLFQDYVPTVLFIGDREPCHESNQYKNINQQNGIREEVFPDAPDANSPCNFTAQNVSVHTFLEKGS